MKSTSRPGANLINSLPILSQIAPSPNLQALTNKCLVLLISTSTDLPFESVPTARFCAASTQALALPLSHLASSLSVWLSKQPVNNKALIKEVKDRTFVNLCITNPDRKSTRLNSSHQIISYAVFCLKK